MASVMLWATVNAVTVFNSIHRSLTISKQPQHEEHVVSAEKNMPDALHDVGAGHAHPSLRRSNFHPRLRGMHDGRQLPAVQQFNAHQDVGNRELQPGKLDALACQTVGPGVDPSALHEGVGQFLHVGLSHILYVVRKLERYRKPHPCKHWGAPEHAELSGRSLFDLEIGGARLVGRRNRNGKQQTRR